MEFKYTFYDSKRLLIDHPLYNNFKDKFDRLSKEYKYYVPVKSDNNCFYTTFIYQLCRFLPTLSIEVLLNMKVRLNSFEERFELVKLPKLVYEDYHKIMYQLVNNAIDIVSSEMYSVDESNSFDECKNNNQNVNENNNQNNIGNNNQNENDYINTLNEEYKNTLNEEYKNTLNEEYKNTLNEEYINTLNEEYKNTLNEEYKNNDDMENNKILITEDYNELTAYLKMVTSTAMKIERHKYEPFLEMDLEKYCKLNIDAFYKMTSYIDITALCDALDIGIKVESLVMDKPIFIGNLKYYFCILHSPSHFEPLI